MSKIEIAMITDDGYVIPTCVAIRSFILNKRADVHFNIHIIAASLNEQTKETFHQFAAEDVTIDVIEVDAGFFEGMHVYDRRTIAVASISALYKFLLPDLLPDCDKVLYLDGDLIARVCLSEIYDVELGDYYAAAVMDSGFIYAHYTREYTQGLQDYINTGVMLLNLKKMREDDMTRKLIEEKRSSTDTTLMDQNVFNTVFNGHIKLLPIRYNYMPVNLNRSREQWSVQEINMFYGSSYTCERDMLEDAAIIHFCSKDKPWKCVDGFCSDLWMQIYSYDAQRLDPQAPQQALQAASEEEALKLTITMVISDEVEGDILRACLDSIFTQQLERFELICTVAPESPRSFDILEDYAKRDPRTKVLCPSDVFGERIWTFGRLRNLAMQKARGKYVYHADPTCMLRPESMQVLISHAERCRLDLLLFGGVEIDREISRSAIISELNERYRYDALFQSVYHGRELLLRLLNQNQFKAFHCLQLVRRSLIEKNDIGFYDMPLLEDDLYTIQLMIHAQRSTVLAAPMVQILSTNCYKIQVEAYRLPLLASSLVTARELLKLIVQYGEDDDLSIALEHVCRKNIHVVRTCVDWDRDMEAICSMMSEYGHKFGHDELDEVRNAWLLISDARYRKAVNGLRGVASSDGKFIGLRQMLRDQRLRVAEIRERYAKQCGYTLETKEKLAEARALLRQEKQKASELRVALQKAQKLYQHTLEAKLQRTLYRAKKSMIYRAAAAIMRKLRKIFRRTENK